MKGIGVCEWKFEREQKSSYSNINTSPPRDSEDSVYYITHSVPALKDSIGFYLCSVSASSD